MKNQSGPNLSSAEQLKRVRWLSWILDNSIKVPGSNFRIGLDPLIGLIPGVGDLIGTALSSYIVVLAVSANVSAWTLTRMTLNILLESMVGVIPIVGDIFDATFKANERNRKLLEASLENPQRKKLDRRFVILIVSTLVLIFGLSAYLAFKTLVWIINTLANPNYAV